MRKDSWGIAPHRIIGIDPGTAIVGYGILDYYDNSSFELITCGTIQTSKALSAGERLHIIRNDLLALIKEYSPAVAVVEAIFFFKNAKTLIPVSQARGVILEAASSRQLSIAEYTPMQVKQCITGSGRADKKAVQEALALYLGQTNIIRPDDAADAVALAICHARMSPLPNITTAC